MKFKKRASAGTPSPQSPEDSFRMKAHDPDGAGPEAAPPADTILVQHGIHTVDYPGGGLTVREVRERLAPVINIDPESVAVVGGNPVVDESEHVLSSSDQILSFVKKSAVKGQGGRAAGGGTGGDRGR